MREEEIDIPEPSAGVELLCLGTVGLALFVMYTITQNARTGRGEQKQTFWDWVRGKREEEKGLN